MNGRPLALVAGVGDGLGKAVARRFARAGHTAVLVARKEDKLQRIGRERLTRRCKRLQADPRPQP